jgi:hypothetical protein
MIVPDATYSIYGVIKTENAEGATFQCRFFDSRSGGNQIDIEHLGLIYGTTDWTYYYKDLTVPDGTNFLDVYCNNEPPSTGEAFARFDDVGLIEWTEWQPMSSDPTNIVNPNDYYFLQVRTTDLIDEITIDFRETSYGNYIVQTENNTPVKPEIAKLKNNYPNPFNPITNIAFDLNITAEVELSIFNIKGQKVKTILNSRLAPGTWNSEWNGKDGNGKKAASGVYFYQLSVNKKKVDARKCLLMK